MKKKSKSHDRDTLLSALGLSIFFSIIIFGAMVPFLTQAGDVTGEELVMVGANNLLSVAKWYGIAVLIFALFIFIKKRSKLHLTSLMFLTAFWIVFASLALLPFSTKQDSQTTSTDGFNERQELPTTTIDPETMDFINMVVSNQSNDDMLVTCNFQHSDSMLVRESVCDSLVECGVGGEYFVTETASKCRDLQADYASILKEQLERKQEILNSYYEVTNTNNVNNNSELLEYYSDLNSVQDRLNKIESDFYNKLSESDRYIRDSINNEYKLLDTNEATYYENVNQVQSDFDEGLNANYELCIQSVNSKYEPYNLWSSSTGDRIELKNMYQDELTQCGILY